jgi:hypothetical protein
VSIGKKSPTFQGPQPDKILFNVFSEHAVDKDVCSMRIAVAIICKA